MPNIRSSIAEADATLENTITKKRMKEDRKRNSKMNADKELMVVKGPTELSCRCGRAGLIPQRAWSLETCLWSHLV